LIVYKDLKKYVAFVVEVKGYGEVKKEEV